MELHFGNDNWVAQEGPFSAGKTATPARAPLALGVLDRWQA